ncbi:endonuclease domain-containing protein [Nocardioides massiliensis]|uniref:Recombination endonuclease VII n=1 Tax=Nocardioides massiliensis TaxID=1325935 RepID=A0ABT9NJ79_9ACTN|nr:hypothetical protein [Nocardioides massiliensis]
MARGGYRQPSNPAAVSGPGALSQKVCIRCGEAKPLDAFKNRAGAADGKRNDCRACSWRREELRRGRPEVRARILAAQRERRRRNYTPESGRARNISFRFRLTAEDYASLLADQGDACAICGSEPEPGTHLAVDHDHSCCPPPKKRTCGACIRGLLCSGCNKALGGFKDSPDLLSAAIRYLTETANG